MVYRKKRVSRIKSKRSGINSKLSRTKSKRSRTKSRRRVKRTQMKGKFKKRLFLKGGSGNPQEITLTRNDDTTSWGFTMPKASNVKFITEVKHHSLADKQDIIPGQSIIKKIDGIDITSLGWIDSAKLIRTGKTLTIINPNYTNMENSSPILDSIIKSIDDIKTILEFIRDIKGGNIRYLLCKIGQREHDSCSKNNIYTQIFNKIMKYEYIFTHMNLLNFTESNDRENILFNFLKFVILQVLQFELLVFLTNNIPFLNDLLNTNYITSDTTYKDTTTYKDILKNITLVDIKNFCTKFKLPPNTSCDKIILDTANPTNLFDYLTQLYEEEEDELVL
jgi:hypothetical protein